MQSPLIRHMCCIASRQLDSASIRTAVSSKLLSIRSGPTASHSSGLPPPIMMICHIMKYHEVMTVVIQSKNIQISLLLLPSILPSMTAVENGGRNPCINLAVYHSMGGGAWVAEWSFQSLHGSLAAADGSNGNQHKNTYEAKQRMSWQQTGLVGWVIQQVRHYYE